jgi:hypothetical protein
MLHNWIFAIRLNTLMLEQPKFIGFPYKQEKNFMDKHFASIHALFLTHRAPIFQKKLFILDFVSGI